MRNFETLRFLALIASLSILACSDPTSSQGTNSDQSCETTSDCEAGQTCSLKNPNDSTSTDKVCLDIQCQTNADCTTGKACKAGLCIGENSEQKTKCTNDADCSDGKVCVADQCIAASTVTSDACKPCTEITDCSDGLNCSSITAGATDKYCFSPCTSHSQCPGGWLCGADGSGPSCVPGLYQCSGCLTEGCDAGQFCMADKGICTAAAGICDPCTVDGQCGPGKRCVGNNSKSCVPECPDGTCENGGVCKANDFGVMVCEWPNMDAPCCLVEGCGGSRVTDPCENVQCQGTKSICINGKCVECTKDTDCMEPGKICAPNNVCQSEGAAQCGGSTPYWSENLGKCCQCQNTTHCAGKTCDGCSCKADSNNTFCDTCTGSYPGCVDYEGQWVCVQCSEDSHCPGSTCDLENYTCKNVGTGGPTPTSGNCQKDGCEVAEAVCDQDSGLCYNPDGSCDNVTVFCLGGQPCIDVMSKLGGGGGGGLPFPIPLPGAAGGGGKCGCDLQGGKYWTQGTCPNGLKCGPHLECWELILGSKISDYYCDPHDLGLEAALCPDGP